MKCPRCGADMSGHTVCGECGMKTANRHKDIEVEYKDFKTSELLEIRQKKHPAPPDNEPTFAGGLPETSHQAPNRSYSVIALALLLLAFIAGAFFIVRYLLLP